MTQGDFIGLGAVLLVGVAVFSVSNWYEFNRAFQRHLFLLHPDDVDKDPYRTVLRGAIFPKKIVLYRRLYAWGSTVLVIFAAFFVAHVPYVTTAFSQIAPPFIYGFLKSGLDYGYVVFGAYHAFLFAICMHAFPVLGLLSRKVGVTDSSLSRGTKGSLVQIALAFFLVQQFFLQRLMANLLRDSSDSLEFPDPGHAKGLISKVVKSRIAHAMATVDDEVLQMAVESSFPPMTMDQTYGEDVAREEASPGFAGAMAAKASFRPMDRHTMILALIDKHGVPQVRSMLRWCHEERGRRHSTELAVSGKVDEVDFCNAWVRNVGESLDENRLKSLRIDVPAPDPQLKAAARPHARLELTEIGSAELNKPIRCRVTRAATASEGSSLCLGSVVEDTCIRRFDQQVRAECQLD